MTKDNPHSETTVRGAGDANRIWFDTEFLEDGETIKLISIGMVREDGATFYAETEDAWHLAESDEWGIVPWLLKNVKPHLRGDVVLSRKRLAERIVEFAGPNPEFWAYYADYDWVALCQLFGRMIDLPKGWPMFCRDVQQWRDELGKPDLPKQDVEHDALADALWTRDAWMRLREIREATAHRPADPVPAPSEESRLQEAWEDDLIWLRGQVLELCESTEEKCSVAMQRTEDGEIAYHFNRGRVYEAKGIRRTVAEVVRCRLAERDATRSDRCDTDAAGQASGAEYLAAICKRWRLEGANFVMQPIGEICADEAKALCKQLYKGLKRSPAPVGIGVEEIAAILDREACEYGDLEYYGPARNRQTFSARKRVAFNTAQVILARITASAEAGRGSGETQAALDVLAERQRQVHDIGWRSHHDDRHTDGALARAAAAYARHAGSDEDTRQVNSGFAPEDLWTLNGMHPWRPSTRRRDLVKAGALILAEIERLDRAAPASGPVEQRRRGMAPFSPRPIVTTLCGSSRFPDAFALANMHLSMLGRVVISLGCFGHADQPVGARFLTSDGDEKTPEKQQLDQLHFRKIDLSDGIFVVNPGDYIGSSTKREIAYAQSQGKTVEWMFPVEEPRP